MQVTHNECDAVRVLGTLRQGKACLEKNEMKMIFQKAPVLEKLIAVVVVTCGTKCNHFYFQMTL